MNLDGIGDAWAGEFDRDLRSRRSHQLVLRLLRRPVDDVNGIDLNDAIALAYAGRFGGRVREDLTDDDLLLLRLDLHADTTVPTACVGREGLEILGREQLAVRIVELFHEAARGLLVELALIEGIDEALVDELEHLVEQRFAAASNAGLEHEAASDERKHNNAGEREFARASDP